MPETCLKKDDMHRFRRGVAVLNGIGLVLVVVGQVVLGAWEMDHVLGTGWWMGGLVLAGLGLRIRWLSFMPLAALLSIPGWAAWGVMDLWGWSWGWAVIWWIAGTVAILWLTGIVALIVLGLGKKENES